MRGTICIILLATVLMVGIISSSAVAGPTNFCTSTSHDALTSCDFGVRDGYNLALGKCENLLTGIERRDCRQQALNDKQSGFEECRAQFAKRQEICRTLGKDPYNPVIDPANFSTSTTINNPYFPLKPGTTYTYEGITEKGFEHDEVTVTSETKDILGVTCVVVRDTVKVGVPGVLEEATIDWYAQDNAGNVWYFGENSLEYDSSGLIISLGGSWMAGVDGAKPGIIMKANRVLNDLYRQEFALGEAEDMAEVISLDQPTAVAISGPLGPFDHCVETEEFSPLEPDVVEHKFYALGIGNVQIVDPSILGQHLDLISITLGP
jgi:hypothetical protein